MKLTIVVSPSRVAHLVTVGQRLTLCGWDAENWPARVQDKAQRDCKSCAYNAEGDAFAVVRMREQAERVAKRQEWEQMQAEEEAAMWERAKAYTATVEQVLARVGAFVRAQYDKCIDTPTGWILTIDGSPVEIVIGETDGWRMRR